MAFKSGINCPFLCFQTLSPPTAPVQRFGPGSLPPSLPRLTRGPWLPLSSCLLWLQLPRCDKGLRARQPLIITQPRHLNGPPREHPVCSWLAVLWTNEGPAFTQTGDSNGMFACYTGYAGQCTGPNLSMFYSYIIYYISYPTQLKLEFLHIPALICWFKLLKWDKGMFVVNNIVYIVIEFPSEVLFHSSIFNDSALPLLLLSNSVKNLRRPVP